MFTPKPPSPSPSDVHAPSHTTAKSGAAVIATRRNVNRVKAAPAAPANLTPSLYGVRTATSSRCLRLLAKYFRAKSEKCVQRQISECFVCCCHHTAIYSKVFSCYELFLAGAGKDARQNACGLNTNKTLRETLNKHQISPQSLYVSCTWSNKVD